MDDLSDDCMREMQARNVLKTRYHKFRLSLLGTIDAIKEFAKAELTVVELPSNPFDIENLPQIASSEPIQRTTWKLTQHTIKSTNNSSSDKNFPLQSVRNCSLSLAFGSNDSGSRIHDSNANSIYNSSQTFITSGSNTSEEWTQFPNPSRYDNTRIPKKKSHASQISENHLETHNNRYRSCLPGSSANSTVSSHTLTYAALSPAEESKEKSQEKAKMIGSEGEQLYRLKNSYDEDTNVYDGQHFVNEMFNGRSIIQRLVDHVGGCENSSRFSNVRNNSENFLLNKAGNISNGEQKTIYSMDNVLKTFEPLEKQRHLAMVVPSPDLSCDSSDDEDDLEQRQFNNTTNNRGFRRKMSVIKPDPSSIYAKRSDLISHKAPPSKQLVNSKMTWVESQRDFYIAFVNEQRKYGLLERDIAEQSYESLVGQKVEEGEPCMVLKNGQFYRALLESSVENTCHVFLVDFGGYLIISRREVAPMLQQHAQLPMAAIHCSIFGAFRVKLTIEAIDYFRRKFPIDSTFKLLFVRRSEHGNSYETQLYLRENMQHDAFLPLKAYFD
ncbi:Tudor domain family protein [Acanthocheilonema viteae]